MKTIAGDVFSKSDIQPYIHEQTQQPPENVISIVAGRGSMDGCYSYDGVVQRIR